MLRCTFSQCFHQNATKTILGKTLFFNKTLITKRRKISPSPYYTSNIFHKILPQCCFNMQHFKYKWGQKIQDCPYLSCYDKLEENHKSHPPFLYFCYVSSNVQIGMSMSHLSPLPICLEKMWWSGHKEIKKYLYICLNKREIECPCLTKKWEKEKRGERERERDKREGGRWERERWLTIKSRSGEKNLNKPKNPQGRC